MPDTTTTPDRAILEHREENAVSSPIQESIDLESILEDISLECVLADVSDPESFKDLLALLKEFFQASRERHFPELAEDARKAGKIVKTIMEDNSPDKSDSGILKGAKCNSSSSNSDIENHNRSDIESRMESLNLIISEMKSFLHFITRSPEASTAADRGLTSDLEPYSSSPDSGKGESIDQPGQEQSSLKLEMEERSDSKAKEEISSEVASEVQFSTTNILHPGQLPPFLNIEDFAEFLSLQKKSLDKVEALILDIEKNHNRDYAQNELKRLFHTTKGEAGFLGLKDIEMVCHRAEDLMATENFGSIVDILLALKDWLEATYNAYAGNPGKTQSAEDIIKLLDREQSEPAPDSNWATPEPESDWNGYQSSPEKPLTPMNPPQFMTESINVDADRLDRLIDIIGELAIAESMVTQSAEIAAIASSTILRSLSALHKITKELQTLGLGLRMVPLRSIFKRMERVVRDLAQKTGKEINFTVKGEATELDKTQVDKLGDPLIHLIRNSVDHGIEDNVHQRVNAGKPKTATIELRAFHKGGNLFIEVEDDGRGVNRKRLKEKAISQNIITYEQQLDGEELLNLVFHPGLTTANGITAVSGRGVGMDVVKKSIESCRGKVSISSIEGRGTTCTIKIPLTLSIIDGLVVRVTEEIYVIPTLSVVTSLKMDKNKISNVFGKGEMISVLGKLIPLFRLNSLFKLKGGGKESHDGIIVVVEESGLKIALLVDELVGKQNTVIKNLGLGMEDMKGISGGTIMADGRVSLIIDVAGIIELSHL